MCGFFNKFIIMSASEISSCAQSLEVGASVVHVDHRSVRVQTVSHLHVGIVP